MNITEKERAAIELEVSRCVTRLNEMGCDSVSLFTTCRRGRATESICAFEGNYYARTGLVREWLAFQDAVEVEGEVDDVDDDAGI
jgi:hypothetical protein